MKYVMVSMLDRKASFNPPSATINTEVAKRSFAYAINNEGVPSSAPADFELYLVGYFDDATGKIEEISPPELICTGFEVFGK